MNKPKCPDCGSLSHNIGTMTRTLMGVRAWTDEDGTYHNEDPNITTEERTCRKCGRRFSVKLQGGKLIV